MRDAAPEAVLGHCEGDVTKQMRRDRLARRVKNKEGNYGCV